MGLFRRSRSPLASKVVALAGNPNTGKSTVFNALTGLKQHTGNWPGKTVLLARGTYTYQGRTFTLVDLPGTYSLLAHSAEEEVARDFLCFARPDAVVAVVDATCLERNLNLVLQLTEITPRVVVCVNLIDEARRNHLEIDVETLAALLGVPVVPASARRGQGLLELKEAIEAVVSGRVSPQPRTVRYDDAIEEQIAQLAPLLQPLLELLASQSLRLDARWVALRLLEGDKTFWNRVRELAQGAALPWPEPAAESDAIRDRIVLALYRQAEEISARVIRRTEGKEGPELDRSLDRILTSRLWGYPSMLALLGIIFWLTLSGANYPSALLGRLLFGLQDRLSALFLHLGAPAWLHDLLVLGMYRCLAWVVSVMLPPMAIFFPLFTLLEDLGYLPRVAFNLDKFFRRAGAHGKQALTMSMGFGCNAAGVVACRIIDSPRERLIAILTNNFVPCNGRFPTLITFAALLTSGVASPSYSSLAAAGLVAAFVLLGIALTLGVSWGLSRTLLQGTPSSFALELPPYRPPQVGRVIIRSLFDRTLFVLGRAVTVAAPAGAIIWLLANLPLGNRSLITYLVGFLDPLGHQLGLDGHILTAFLLGFPANETVVPILLMSYLSAGSMLQITSPAALRQVLQQNGWTWLTAFNTMLLMLLHYPCGTTLLTIRKEAGHAKWALLAALIPTALGVALCFAVARAARLLKLV